MKVKILAGLVTALIYSGTAMAQDVSDEQHGKDTQQQSPDNFGGAGLDDNNANDLIILDQEDVAPVAPEKGAQDQGVGGSGQSAPQAKPGMPIQQGGMTLYCTPVQQGATGGSGTFNEPLPQPQPQLQPQPQPQPQNLQGQEQSSLQPGNEVDVGKVVISDQEKGFGGAGYEETGKESKSKMRGLTVLLGAGVEGYTGGLAPNINPGPSVDVLAALRPSKTFGLELGYSGAANNIDNVGVTGSGPDIIRNSAQAAITVGLTAAPVQPYVLGGYGMNWYNVRNGQALGFVDDTNSKIPLGVGLRTHLGSFTADARVNYNVLLSDDFAPGVDNSDFGTGSYNGTINLGGTF